MELLTVISSIVFLLMIVFSLFSAGTLSLNRKKKRKKKKKSRKVEISKQLLKRKTAADFYDFFSIKNKGVLTEIVTTSLTVLFGSYAKLKSASDIHGIASRRLENSSRCVEILFGTDRENAGPSIGFDEEPRNVDFTHRRSLSLTLGSVLVSVPADVHRLGRVELPYRGLFGTNFLRQEPDPEKHFTRIHTETFSESEFMLRGSSYADIAKRYERTALVYLHGYNVTFEDAVFRAAQLAFDTKFDGPKYVYSWPSSGKKIDYQYDFDSARFAASSLAEFLVLISSTPGIKHVHLIAHSMGNLALTEVVLRKERLFDPVLSEKLLSQVVMAAPDVDAENFRSVAQDFKDFADGITIYASSKDAALKASKAIRKSTPRLGDVVNGQPFVYEAIDTIDVSAVGAEVFSLNHSTYAEARSLLDDLGALLKDQKRPPDARMATMQKKTSDAGQYWILPR